MKKIYFMILPFLFITLLLTGCGKKTAEDYYAADETSRPPYEIRSVRVVAGDFTLTEAETTMLNDFLTFDAYLYGGPRYADNMQKIAENLFSENPPSETDCNERISALRKDYDEEVYLDGSATAKILSITEDDGEKTIELEVTHSVSYGYAPDYTLTNKQLFILKYTLVVVEDGEIIKIKELTADSENPF